MKTSTKKVTREEFIDTINTCNNVIKKLHPFTRLAEYCQGFLLLNKKVIKAHNKLYEHLTKDLTTEMRNFKIANCIEKDGHLLKTPSGEYQFDRAGELAISKKQDEINEKINVVLDKYLDEQIIVTCQIDALELPSDIAMDTEQYLNGFVFQNKKLNK